MKKNLTELVFIVDRSGSMGGLETDTIGGINALITFLLFLPLRKILEKTEENA